MSILNISSNISLSNLNDGDIVLVDASGGAVVVTLPHSVDISEIEIRKIDSTDNFVTVRTKGIFDRINNQTSLILSETNNNVVIVSDRKTLFFTKDYPSTDVAETLNSVQLQLAINSASLSASISSPIYIDLPHGTFTLSSSIALASHVIVRGSKEGTTLQAYISGAADEPTNAVFYTSLPTGSVVTTLSLSAHMGQRVIRVVDPSNIQIDSWLCLTGNNSVLSDPGPWNASTGGGVTHYELVQVQSLSGNVLILKSPLRTFQGLGKSVIDVTPVIGAGVEDLTVTSTGSVAVGIHLRGAQRCKVDISGEDFSRAIINADRGAADNKFSAFNLGSVNCSVFIQSSHNNITAPLKNLFGCAGFNLKGIRRAVYVERDMPAANILEGMEEKGLNIYGLLLWGTQRGVWRNINIEGCDATDTHASMITAGEQGENGRYAYVWFGRGDVPNAEFGFYGKLENVNCFNNIQTESYGSQIWLHDQFSSLAKNLNCVETQFISSSYVGIRVHDCSFQVQQIQASGHRISMLIENDPSNCNMEDVILVPQTPASGGVCALYLDAITLRGMRIDRLVFGNAGFTSMFAFGSSFAFANNAEQLMITEVTTDAPGFMLKSQRLFFAYQDVNHILSFGQLAELKSTSPAGSRYIAPPSGAIASNPSTRVCSVFQGKNFGGTGWCVMQELKGGFVYVAQATVPGDSLRPADPTGEDNQTAVVDNAPADFNIARSIFGKSLSSNAGAGYVQVM